MEGRDDQEPGTSAFTWTWPGFEPLSRGTPGAGFIALEHWQLRPCILSTGYGFGLGDFFGIFTDGSEADVSKTGSRQTVQVQIGLKLTTVAQAVIRLSRDLPQPPRNRDTRLCCLAQVAGRTVWKKMIVLAR